MKIYITIFLLIFATNIFGQIDNESRYFIKYEPLGSLNLVTPNIQFSLEQRIAPNRSIHYSLGAIFKREGVNLFYSETDNFKGYVFRVEYRKYKHGFKVEERNSFKGWNILGRQFFFEDIENMCLTPDCTSFIEKPYVSMNSMIGAAYGVGWNKVYNKNFLLEFEIIGGISYLKRQKLGLPPLASLPRNLAGFTDNFFNFGNNLLIPTLQLVVRVGLGV